MTLHRHSSRLLRWSDLVLALCLLGLMATTFATVGAALKPEREAQIVISYGCDPGETSPG